MTKDKEELQKLQLMAKFIGSKEGGNYVTRDLKPTYSMQSLLYDIRALEQDIQVHAADSLESAEAELQVVQINRNNDLMALRAMAADMFETNLEIQELKHMSLIQQNFGEAKL